MIQALLIAFAFFLTGAYFGRTKVQPVQEVLIPETVQNTTEKVVSEDKAKADL